MVSLTPFTGVRLITDAFLQSLQILKLPLVLLAAAVLWALTLGGFLNLGGPGGLLRLLIRATRFRTLVVVLRSAEEPLEFHTDPDERSDITFMAGPTLRSITSQGRPVVADDGVSWVRVATDRAEGWADAAFLTEDVTESAFQADDRPREMASRFVEGLESGADISGMISLRGLFVSFSARAPTRLSIEDLTNGGQRTWREAGRVYPAVHGSFEEAVATPLAAAFGAPEHELRVDAPVLASALIPTQFRNFHFISVGSPGALDSWMVFFEYTGGEPRIIGLSVDG